MNYFQELYIDIINSFNILSEQLEAAASKQDTWLEGFFIFYFSFFYVPFLF